MTRASRRTSASTSRVCTVCSSTIFESDILVTDGTEYPKPSATFDRVIQCAENHVASLGDPEVCGDNVLVAIFAEQESYAANLLQLPGMTHDDALKQYKARERLREMSRRFE